jgi:hypothetical protein
MKNVAISADDQRIVLNFADLGSVMRVLSHWNNAFRRDDFVRRLQQTAETLGLDLEVQVQGRTVERFGPGNTSGILRRLMHQLADAAGDARGQKLVALQPRG